MNPYLILAGSLAFCVAVGGSYVKGRADGKAIEEAAVAREERIATASREAAMKAAAEAIAGIEVKNVTIRQTLEKEIHEKPVYRDCRHSPDGLRSINDALSGAVRAGGGELPAARPAQ